MPNEYIPPPGIAFRLYGLSSGRVLFSRTNRKPEVFHHPNGEEHSDQWFEAIPGRGKYAGYYAIRSRNTGKVLFARNSPEPRVGHTDGDGQYDDNWFRFETGSGKQAGYFRLRNFSSDTVLFSRTGTDPQVYNYPGSGKKYDDQYFTALFEDLKVDRIEYKLNQGKILSSTPVVIGSQTLRNESDVQQTMEFNLTDTTTNTSTWEFTQSYSITIGASGKIGIPKVVDFALKLDITGKFDWKSGTTTTTTKTYTARLPVSAPAHSTARAVSSVTRSDIEVPYTIYLKSVATGQRAEFPGIYKGVTTWDLRHKVTSEKEDLSGRAPRPRRR
ncbi:hemolytic lectin [Tricholoma matsutake]|nr:hemolytic lectin [Tricholoma matsutake 945]